MAWYHCLPQTISKLVIGILLFIIGLGAVLIGFTVMPVIGLIAAVPVFALSIYFVKAHLNRECEISQ